MSTLSVQGLTAGHGGVPAVRGLDLSVGPGEVVALLGPNGAGKTTVLETVSGVLPAISGELRIDGSAYHGLRAASKLGLSYLREGRGLFSQLTVRENLRLRTHSRRSADALLTEYPILEPLADRRAGLLSGGEQQVLALACALSVKPKLLLIDEMTMGLAPIMVTQLVALVRRAADTGLAVLFVEQHIHAALELADRAYVLRHGEVVLQGPSGDLSSRLSELHDSYFDLAL